MEDVVLAALLVVDHELHADPRSVRPARMRRVAAVADEVAGIGGVGHASASSIGGIAPGRDEERNMVMPVGLGDGEADRHEIQERRIGRGRAEGPGNRRRRRRRARRCRCGTPRRSSGAHPCAHRHWLPCSRIERRRSPSMAKSSMATPLAGLPLAVSRTWVDRRPMKPRGCRRRIEPGMSFGPARAASSRIPEPLRKGQDFRDRVPVEKAQPGLSQTRSAALG